MSEINEKDFTWIKGNPLCAKMFLGIKGCVISLFESNSGSINYEAYIPSSRQVNLKIEEADKVLMRLFKLSNNNYSETQVETTQYHGKEPAKVFLFGCVYNNSMYMFRVASRDAKILQIWAICEEKDDIAIDGDPVIHHILND